MRSRDAWLEQDHLQHCATAIAILNVGGVGFDQQHPAIGIDQGMALAGLDCLAGVIALWVAAFVVLTFWLSMGTALGLTSRPIRSRSAITRAWYIRSNTASSRNRANQR